MPLTKRHSGLTPLGQNVWIDTEVDTDATGLNLTRSWTNTLASRPIWDESCDVVDAVSEHDSGPGIDVWEDHTIEEMYARSAQARWHLQTGGKAGSRRQNLFVFSGGAAEVLDLRAHFPWSATSTEYTQAIPNEDVRILGKNLDTNGILYKVLPDGQELDVTPEVHGVDFYTFGVGAGKYLSYFAVFVDMPDPNGCGYYVDGSWGHVWWQLSTDAPSEAINPTNLIPFLGKFGYYPTHFTTDSMGSGPGMLIPEIDTDNFSKTYDIGFPDLLSGLEYAKNVHDSPGQYNALIHNCVHVQRGAADAVNVPYPRGLIYPEDIGVYLKGYWNLCH